MELKAMICLVLMLAITLVASVGSTTTDEAFPLALPGCNDTCGDVKVPYPFGMGNSGRGPCFLHSSFNLTCNNTILTWVIINATVKHIDILQGELVVMSYVASFCNEQDFWNAYLRFTDLRFSISSNKNKLITIGYNSYGYLNRIYDSERYSVGCLTRSYGNTGRIINGTCSGIGCCQVDIPPGMRNITIFAYKYNFTDSTNRTFEEYCSYSFVVKQGFYNFSITHLHSFTDEELPLSLDWNIGDKNCTASEGEADYACGKNSQCTNNDFNNVGYRCQCKTGYEGNPYLPDGCKDIDECLLKNHRCLENHCNNTDGSYKCFCPVGKIGDGTLTGGCECPDGQTRDKTGKCLNVVAKITIGTKIAIGSCASFIILFVVALALYLIYQRRKLIKLKKTFFQQNGGYIFLQKISSREDTSRTAQIFTEDQLKKATNNYDESLIIGRGGFGTVFKGTLADNKIVAIKKSKIMDVSQVDQFINEVVVLSQINHRNVVKLLGCCLETEVPLLVYEFSSNGTLFDFIHTTESAFSVTWKTRLRIASETAGALSYLHSAASVPIIHRDVKSANILLDDTYTAKVSDFGASRLVPLDQAEIATMVQGTIGYLDPEYMQTQQLTEKSDVYSFGVVLAELLIGEKPISFDRSEEKRSLAMHFLSCLKENCIYDVLQVGMLSEDNKEEINEVVILAAKCLRLKGEERPSMKEVAMELEGIRLMEKHPWVGTDINLEESHYLLHKETGDSSGNTYSENDSSRVHVSIALNDGR